MEEQQQRHRRPGAVLAWERVFVRIVAPVKRRSRVPLQSPWSRVGGGCASSRRTESDDVSQRGEAARDGGCRQGTTVEQHHRDKGMRARGPAALRSGYCWAQWRGAVDAVAGELLPAAWGLLAAKCTFLQQLRHRDTKKRETERIEPTSQEKTSEPPRCSG